MKMLELKLNEVVVFAETGQFTTQTQAQKQDAFSSNLALLKKIEVPSWIFERWLY